MTAHLIKELSAIVGAEHVLADADLRAPYDVDWTGRFRGSARAVVRPGSVDEVQAIVQLCRRERVALCPQGGNTGLVGGGVALSGELVLSLRRLDAIEPVDTAAGQITVGAGATLGNVRQAAACAGLMYGIDFAARDSATIGGTIATNAGGIGVLRFGGTREQVIGIEAVLGTGVIVRSMRGLVKDNTGYHLPSLLCGSEGTLGVVTAARLRLVRSSTHRVTALIAFRDVPSVIAAMASLRTRMEGLEAAEIMLEHGVTLVCETFGLRFPFSRPAAAYLLIDVAGDSDPTGHLSEVMGFVDGVVDVAVATSELSRAALWRLHDDHTAAINTLGPPHKLDVTLPAQKLCEFIEIVPSEVAAVAPSATTWLFGHVGDGNIHVNVSGLAPDDEMADETVLALVSSLGGSISAEHGVGTAKARWLHLSRSRAEIATMRAIKRALDPDHILNPNVLLPPDELQS